jgi:hypothetical protein
MLDDSPVTEEQEDREEPAAESDRPADGGKSARDEGSEGEEQPRPRKRRPFRRGLLLGAVLGAIGAILSGRRGAQEGEGEPPGDQVRSRFQEAMHEAKRAAEEAERRKMARFTELTREDAT